jgi:hypothetical protein
MATVACVLAGVPSASVADKDDPLVSVLLAGKPELWFSEAPRVNVHQYVTVLARPRGHLKVGTHLVVRVKWHYAPLRRCASSYERDRGHRFRYGAGTRVRARGDVVASTETPTWPRTGIVRFCVWMNRVSHDRFVPARPMSQDVRFWGRIFGAVVAHNGSFAGPGTYGGEALSTVPLRMIYQSTGDCWGRPKLVERRKVPAGGLFTPMTFGGDPLPGCDLESWTFDQLDGPPAQRDLGTITYSAAELAMPADTAPIKHVGACLLDPGEERTVAEAIAYLRAVGCKPGRVVTEPSPPSVTPAAAPGEVYRLAAPGGVRARIAPPGTVVDIFVNP